MGGRDRTLFATAWAPRDPWRVEVGGTWADVQVPQQRVYWCAPCRFITISHHERATMTHPKWHEGRRLNTLARDTQLLVATYKYDN